MKNMYMLDIINISQINAFVVIINLVGYRSNVNLFGPLAIN